MPNAEGPRGPRRPQRPGGKSGSTSGGRGAAPRNAKTGGAGTEKRGERRPDERARDGDRQPERASGRKRFDVKTGSPVGGRDAPIRGTKTGNAKAERRSERRTDDRERGGERQQERAPGEKRFGGRGGSTSGGRGAPGRGTRNEGASTERRGERRPDDRERDGERPQGRGAARAHFAAKDSGEKDRGTGGRSDRGGRSAGRPHAGRDEAPRQDDRFAARPPRRGPTAADDRRPAGDERSARPRTEAAARPRNANETGRTGSDRYNSPPQRSAARQPFGQAPDRARPVRLPGGRGGAPAKPRAAADDGTPREGDRIAKLLARAGVASRRDVERMIEEGRIALNGETVATPATLLTSLHGITVDGKPVKEPGAAQLFLFHKPSGYLTASRDPLGRPTIYDRLPADLPRVMPVGRLDMTTEGLLLLTTDGELKRQLELPSTGVERTYRARAFGEVSQAQLEELIDGVEIDGMRYGRINANLERSTGHNQWIEMTITEGKNREVRRVLEHLGLTVSRLIRTRYGPFTLGESAPGEVVQVPQADLGAFRKTLKK